MSSVDLDAPPTPADEAWKVDLMALLASGASAADAVAHSGALGHVPDDVIKSAIRECVSHPLFGLARRFALRLHCRDWLLRAYAKLAETPGAPPPFETRTQLTREEFHDRFYFANRAVFLPGWAAAWPAVARWTPDYLIDRCGHATVEIMSERDTAPVSDQNTSCRLRQKVSFADYVRSVFEDGPSNARYLVSRNRFFEQTETRVLLEDVPANALATVDPSGVAVKLWFGPAGTITPLHHDDRNNVIVQIVGSKLVRMHPAYYAFRMKQAQPWYAGFDPAGDGSDPSQAPPALRVRLSPGDALFIPVGWWHHIVAESPSITLAFTDFGLPNAFDLPQ